MAKCLWWVQCPMSICVSLNCNQISNSIFYSEWIRLILILYIFNVYQTMNIRLTRSNAISVHFIHFKFISKYPIYSVSYHSSLRRQAEHFSWISITLSNHIRNKYYFIRFDSLSVERNHEKKIYLCGCYNNMSLVCFFFRVCVCLVNINRISIQNSTFKSIRDVEIVIIMDPIVHG